MVEKIMPVNSGQFKNWQTYTGRLNDFFDKHVPGYRDTPEYKQYDKVIKDMRPQMEIMIPVIEQNQIPVKNQIERVNAAPALRPHCDITKKNPAF